MTKNNLIIFCSLIGIIIILSAIIIFRKPQVIIQKEDSGLRDSLVLMTNQIEADKTKTIRLKSFADSILSLKPKIIYIHDKEKDFSNNANINQLDSIIRANSGI